MKVDSTTNSNLPTLKDALSRSQQSDATPADNTAQSASTASQTTASGSGDASVSLSGLSQHLRSLAASGSADIDTAHVESIKQAIKDGTLQDRFRQDRRRRAADGARPVAKQNLVDRQLIDASKCGEVPGGVRQTRLASHARAAVPSELLR